MAMKRCPVCGERYSDTYRNCPFCAEEERMRKEEPSGKRRGGHRMSQSGPSLLSPVLIVVIVLLALLLAYLLFGNTLREKLGGASSSGSSSGSISAVEPGVVSGSGDSSSASASGSGAASAEPEPEPEMTYETAAALPAGLTLSTTDFSLMNAGETHTVTVSGGSGTYQWFSEDEGIVAVDNSGKVTAISGGTVNIVVTDGQVQGTCIVRNRFSGGLTAAPVTGGDTGSGGAHTINREDMTLKLSEAPFQLQITGVTTALTWTSSNAGVAAVAADGTVTPVSVGTATVTAAWDGGSLSCIVRVVN